jgi:alkanesulfonate monooxygenase SsuD/methylene tetrahydromethanopterin reductase-like flavin-dependent oxidoreductase (luciferase family)
MADVELGINVDPTAADVPLARRLAQLTERSGLDLIGVQDHPYQRRFLDTWTLLTHLATLTERIRVVPDVANLPLRPPAMLAKAAASLDLLSGGRVELGLGAGGFWDAIAAMGGPRRTPGEALGALGEAIDVIRLMWSDQRSVRFDGRHYQLAGVHPGPQPAHDVGIWVGGYGPRMLELIGRTADGWVPSSSYVPPDQLPDRQARIDEAAASAGRQPTAIRRVYNVMGLVREERGETEFEGPPAMWVDKLTRLTLEVGMTTYLYWPAADHERQVQVFAHEVAPAVREAVRSE